MDNITRMHLYEDARTPGARVIKQCDGIKVTV